MKATEKRFKKLISVLAKRQVSGLAEITKAWEFACLSHSGQRRLSGEPFVVHPLAVAETLSAWQLDTETTIAGLLHDSIEDGGARPDDILKGFGEEVYLLVDGVTKVTSLRLRGSSQENFVENLRKMLLVMAQDIRVVLLKLADRLHNMETLWALPPEKRVENARETLEVYAPLAERLGMGEVKGMLEDLAFPYVYPDEYEWTLGESKKYYTKTDQTVRKMKRALAGRLAKEKILAEIHGRSKHLYSLYKKLIRPEIDRDFAKIYDMVAIRIITHSIPDCYGALGTVHMLYKPVPHIGISDFIAQPKPNGYQSIHTKVFGPDGNIAEIQIRTRSMHEQAEYGLAAHWFYSDKKGKGLPDQELEKGTSASPKKLSWVKELVAWQNELSDSKEFLKTVKLDVLARRNFIFSPKGDVYDLPAGATPVDFAYAVHTEIGNHIKSAKVNGKLVPLSYKLRSGEVVDVVVDKKQKPGQDWLKFVVTKRARAGISRYLKQERLE